MRTRSEVVGETTHFVLVDVPHEYEQAARELGFELRSDRSLVRVIPARGPHVDRAYENFSRHAEDMVLQAASVEAPPWEAALSELLDRLDDREIKWWLTGSGALAIRGLDVTPRDLDLVVDDSGATELGNVLADCLVEPVTRVTDWFCRWWGRAFLMMRLEWVGGVDDRADEPLVTDFGPTAASRLQTVTWNGRAVLVPPLDLQLLVSERRDRRDRVDRIQGLLGVHQPDGDQ